MQYYDSKLLNHEAKLLLSVHKKEANKNTG